MSKGGQRGKTNMRTKRKRLWDNWFQNIDEMVEYVKRVKDLNHDRVECEITEMFDGWHVTVWQVKFPE